MHFGCVEAVWFLWDCELPVDFWWPVNTLLEMRFLEGQDGAVVGVLASSPLRIILNEHV